MGLLHSDEKRFGLAAVEERPVSKKHIRKRLELAALAGRANGRRVHGAAAALRGFASRLPSSAAERQIRRMVPP